MKPHLSVIVPAYNESERIAPTLRAVHNWIRNHPISAEILVIDDGSTDRTVSVVHALGLRDVRVIRSQPNRGKGHAVKLGILSARGEVRLFMDADGSTPIAELPKLWAAVLAGADVAIGSRHAPGAVQMKAPPWYRRLWSRAANWVVQRLFLAGISDTQCGFKLFTARAAEDIFSRACTPGWGFDLEVLAIARRLGFRVAELPVTWVDDRRSRISPVRDAWLITVEFCRIRRAIQRGDYDVGPSADSKGRRLVSAAEPCAFVKAP